MSADKLLHVHGINAAYLLDNLGGDMAFYRELLTVFYEAKKNFVPDLKTRIASGDLAAASMMLHSYLGSAANCGAEKASVCGRKVYNRMKTGSLEGAEAELAEFLEEAESLITDLGKKLTES